MPGCCGGGVTLHLPDGQDALTVRVGTGPAYEKGGEVACALDGILRQRVTVPPALGASQGAACTGRELRV